MAKKDLKAAAARGADLFFSAADIDNTQNTDYTHDTHDTAQPHKAQDEQPAQLAETIEDMQAAIEADEQKRQEKQKEREQRKADEKRVNIALSSKGYEYCKIMGAVTGKGMGRFIADLIDREATTNNDIYNRAKGIIDDARQ